MKKLKNKKRKPAEILGLTRAKLTVKECRTRAKTLRTKVEKGQFTGDNAALARRWANWYASRANQLSA